VSGVGVLALAALSGLGGWHARAIKGEGAATSAKEAHVRVDSLAKALGEFKTEVAREYASVRLLDQMEARVVSAINRLGDRLDRAIDRAPGKE
jgi:hypothetical protein